jgi:hypothetical protein
MKKEEVKKEEEEEEEKPKAKSKKKKAVKKKVDPPKYSEHDDQMDIDEAFKELSTPSNVQPKSEDFLLFEGISPSKNPYTNPRPKDDQDPFTDLFAACSKK